MMEIRQQQDVTVVEPLRSRLDASVAVRFKEQMAGIIGQGHNRLVVNLSAVDFIDSSGLGAFVSTLKSLGGQGEIAICNVHGGVATMFKLTRMDKIFTICVDEAAAVKQVAA
jgi:anti-sigma B factor antagonist